MYIDRRQSIRVWSQPARNVGVDDVQLDAAQSQNDLTKFDKMYGLSSTAAAAVEPVAPIDKKKKTPKRQIHRTSSFTDELDNLLQDIL